MATNKKQPADAVALAPYTVGDCPVLHDGVRYESGETIELTPDQAKSLGYLVIPSNKAE